MTPAGAAPQPAKGDRAADARSARDGGNEDRHRGDAHDPGHHSDAPSTADHRSSARILNQGHSSTRARFLQPVVAKQGSMFLLCARDGDIVAGSEHGLYFHDMRYLSRGSLRIEGQPLQPLLANSSEGYRTIFELSNPDITDDGNLRVRKETLGIRREQGLGDEYTETLTIRNHATEPARFGLSIEYAADFVDMFEVRGTRPGERGMLHDPEWHGSTLKFGYDGADRHERSIDLAFSRRPAERSGGRAHFRLDLDSQETWELKVRGRISDRVEGDGGRLESKPSATEGPGAEDLRRSRGGAIGDGMQVETDNELFNEVLVRSLLDLHMLSMRERQQPFFAAGVPWYVALFGRDSLLTAIQMAPFEPQIAAHTLRVLASYQGTKVDDEHDEQPGRILHELRVGEMANLGEVPQSPYYGTVDATPLFLVLLGIHASWTGSLDLFHELRDNVDGCLTWLDRYADSDGDGFVDYVARSPKGLRNQGWKDSGNSIVFEDGRLAEPPIALPEVQGYAHLAWAMTAGLFRRDGDEDRARSLEERAAGIAAAFNDGFWLGDEGYYAFCRDRSGAYSRSIASNPAAALWTGIMPPDRAAKVVERAMREDMFSGWGVRTLSSQDGSYNPIDYQVGSVWPHDNSFIAAGMHRYGFVQQADRIFDGIFSAARQFEHFRLPEVFAGYDQAYSSVPVNYPVACSPQAWAAGTIPHLLTTALGLRPQAFARRLVIERPWLPEWLSWVQVRGLRLGDGTADLRYERSGDTTLVAVQRVDGMRVVVEYE